MPGDQPLETQCLPTHHDFSHPRLARCSAPNPTPTMPTHPEPKPTLTSAFKALCVVPTPPSPSRYLLTSSPTSAPPPGPCSFASTPAPSHPQAILCWRPLPQVFAGSPLPFTTSPPRSGFPCNSPTGHGHWSTGDQSWNTCWMSASLLSPLL